MNIIITLSTHEITSHNKCQIIFLDKLVLKKIDYKLMINNITCSMLESTSTYDYGDMYNGVSK